MLKNLKVNNSQMFGKNSIYVLNPKNIKDKDHELVGEQGIELAKLYKTNLKVPESFVITTLAFDDFLTANDVIESIMSELKKVQPFIKSSALQSTENIKNVLKNTKLPSIILSPIEHAYKNLSDSGNPIVNVYASHIIDNKYLSEKSALIFENVKGLDDLYASIQKAYFSLFSLESIETRTNNYFKGGISIALIVQKSLASDLSGKLYSFPPISREDNTLEIQAIYGSSNGSRDEENSYDIYKLDSKTGQINEKQIIPQEYMHVRKGKISKGENAFLKVQISEDWQKKQKLNDLFIEKLYNAYKKIDAEYTHDFVAKWSIVAGDIYINSVERIEKPKFNDSISLLDLTQSKEHVNSLTKEEKYFDKIEKKKDETVTQEIKTLNLDSLTKEIQGIVDGDLPSPEGDEANKKAILQKEKLDQGSNDDNTVLKENLTFLTEIFLDVSKMNSASLENVKKFNGGFFNGTEAILRNSILPEEVLNNQSDLNSLIEKISLDIATAAKTCDPSPLIYQFSNIGDFERKLLGVDENKYHSNGDERFIESPETIAVESLGVLKARNVYSNKNIRVSIPAIRNAKNFIDIKKILSSQNFRRSNSLKFYCEISVPSIIFEILDLDESALDGIIVDYNLLLRLTTYREELREVDQSIGMKMLKLIFDSAKPLGLEVIIKLNTLDTKILKQIMEFKPNALILRSEPTQEFLEVIRDFERENIKSLTKDKRRGRRIKELF